MNIAISTETRRLLENQMEQGGYRSPDEAVRAGLRYLEQQERIGGFEPGELDALLAVADVEIERGEVLDGEEVFRELRELGEKGRDVAG